MWRKGILVAVCLGGLLMASFFVFSKTEESPPAIYLGLSVPQSGSSVSDFSSLASRYGARVSLFSFKVAWEHAFPKTDAALCLNMGALPFLTWLIGEDNYVFEDILSGLWDDYFRQWALEAKAFSYPFLLRIQWVSGPEDEQLSAYNYIWSLFQSEGAVNVLWQVSLSESDLVKSRLESSWWKQSYPEAMRIDGVMINLEERGVSMTMHRAQQLAEGIAGLPTSVSQKPVVIADWPPILSQASLDVFLEALSGPLKASHAVMLSPSQNLAIDQMDAVFSHSLFFDDVHNFSELTD